jgi:hypothetical protein
VLFIGLVRYFVTFAFTHVGILSWFLHLWKFIKGCPFFLDSPVGLGGQKELKNIFGSIKNKLKI